MAKGKKCRICGYDMYASKETNQPKGRWVVYVCRNIRKPCTNPVCQSGLRRRTNQSFDVSRARQERSSSDDDHGRPGRPGGAE